MPTKQERKQAFADKMRAGITVKPFLKDIFDRSNYDYVSVSRDVISKGVIPNYEKKQNMTYYNIDMEKLPKPCADFEDGSYYHCDDMSNSDGCLPECVKSWVDHNRLPAYMKLEKEKNGVCPVLFATDIHTGGRVRLTMASRFGDVGINFHLNAQYGYSTRVQLIGLKDFSETI